MVFLVNTCYEIHTEIFPPLSNAVNVYSERDKTGDLFSAYIAEIKNALIPNLPQTFKYRLLLFVHS